MISERDYARFPLNLQALKRLVLHNMTEVIYYMKERKRSQKKG